MQTHIISGTTTHLGTSAVGQVSKRSAQRPTLAARIVRGLFLTIARPSVPNLTLIAKAVCSQIMRQQNDCPSPSGPELHGVIVITGPSGGGKSMLLAAIECELLKRRRARHQMDASDAGKIQAPGVAVNALPQSPSRAKGEPDETESATATIQNRPLIVRADMLRHAVSVQGVRQRTLLRNHNNATTGAAAFVPRSAQSATTMLTCDPPLDAGTATEGVAAAAGRAASRGRQYHTRIQPADVRAVHEWLACLASAGLADASVLLLPLHKLSTGQRARHTLAVAMHRCTRLQRWEVRSAANVGTQLQNRCVLLVDELGSALDSITAVSVAISLRRWAIANNIAIVVASADASVATALKPQLEVELPLHNGFAGPQATSRGRAKR